ncbi:hypothetical protein AB0G02_35015, partial [Actinosynnema sp. NPDC023658]|uniref:hypothetical protein n=1 Tax=Actinosynnema sp. NPDC023658 TaxID=3155465 RepID=UPI003409D37D
VDMGARWNSPESGTFLSRDRTDYAEGDSVLANRFTYGAADPLGNEDPDGNWPKISCGFCKKVGDFVSSTVQRVESFVRNPGSSLRRLEDFGKRLFKSAVKRVTGLVDKGRKALSKAKAWGKRKVNEARKWAGRQWKRVTRGLDKARRGIGRLLKNAENRGRRLIHDAREKAERAREWAEETARKVEKARKALREKVTRKAREVIEWTAKQLPVKIVAAAVKPLMSAVKPLVSAVAHMPAAVVGVFRGDPTGVARVARDLVEVASAPVESVVGVTRAIAESPQFQSMPCEGAFNCVWRGALGSLPINLAGGDTAPDYLTLDGSVATRSFGPLAFSRSISITVTSHGQVSWGLGAGVSTPGAGVGLRGGWLNKAKATKEEINGFAVGPSLGWTATAQRYWIMPAIGTSHTLPDTSEYAYEAGVSIGVPSKSGIDAGIGVSDSKCLIGCTEQGSSW